MMGIKLPEILARRTRSRPGGGRGSRQAGRHELRAGAHQPARAAARHRARQPARNGRICTLRDLTEQRRLVYMVGDKFMGANSWRSRSCGHHPQRRPPRVHRSRRRAGAGAAEADRQQRRARQATTDGIKKIDDHHYQIERSTVNNALANLNDLAMQARIVPSFKNGQANGFKLFSIKPDSLYSKIGIQNGDVIQRDQRPRHEQPRQGARGLRQAASPRALDLPVERRRPDRELCTMASSRRLAFASHCRPVACWLARGPVARRPPAFGAGARGQSDRPAALGQPLLPQPPPPARRSPPAVRDQPSTAAPGPGRRRRPWLPATDKDKDPKDKGPNHDDRQQGRPFKLDFDKVEIADLVQSISDMTGQALHRAREHPRQDHHHRPEARHGVGHGRRGLRGVPRGRSMPTTSPSTRWASTTRSSRSATRGARPCPPSLDRQGALPRRRAVHHAALPAEARRPGHGERPGGGAHRPGGHEPGRFSPTC